MVKGQILGGRFGELIARQKHGTTLELGELLACETNGETLLLQVYDLYYGSQLPGQALELISGMQLEEAQDTEVMEPHLRMYNLALLKALVAVQQGVPKAAKALPAIFAPLRQATAADVAFLAAPQGGLYLGQLRSGRGVLPVPISLPPEDVFSHHILIAGTTGKGKSVLMKNLLWHAVGLGVGLLVLDPHDEYFGRGRPGLKDHPSRGKVCYYTIRAPPAGAATLKINLGHLRPSHFDFLSLSSPQAQLMWTYYKRFGREWIPKLLTDDTVDQKAEFHEMSLAVVRRTLRLLLDLDVRDGTLFCTGVFDERAGETVIADICRDLDGGCVVIIDTSAFSGQEELLIGSLLASEIFRRHKSAKQSGELGAKPVVGIVLEEAPRVLGKEVLERGGNIFSTLAREGRKFKVGLVAITQLPSLIPREILANINTKLILGVEMASERAALIESASQDLSTDARAIASLDRGEAIISSNFARFAIPIAIPFFDDTVKESKALNVPQVKVQGLKAP